VLFDEIDDELAKFVGVFVLEEGEDFVMTRREAVTKIIS